MALITVAVDQLGESIDILPSRTALQITAGPACHNVVGQVAMKVLVTPMALQLNCRIARVQAISEAIVVQAVTGKPLY